MSDFLETDRLQLRDWNPDTDAEAAFAIYGDPEVMRYIRAPEPDLLTQCLRLRERVQEYRDRQDRSRFWAVVDKQLSTPTTIVGSIILKRLPDGEEQLTPDWEVGWMLRRSAWGHGYATEAAALALAYGFHTLKLPVIYAVVDPQNLASQRVAQRLGMQHQGRTTSYYGAELEWFALFAPSTTP